jgi:hypothetical protein
MYEYEFVRVAVKYKGLSIDPSVYELPVRDRAEQGWRLVQLFVENPAQMAVEYVLVFERPRSGKP